MHATRLPLPTFSVVSRRRGSESWFKEEDAIYKLLGGRFSIRFDDLRANCTSAADPGRRLEGAVSLSTGVRQIACQKPNLE